MQSKISLGSGFGGCLLYVLNKQGASFLTSNMAEREPLELAREFQAVRMQRDGVKRAVFHCSLSLPAGENMSDEKWSAAIKDYLHKMGFSNSQYIAARHTDTDHAHVHIIANRIDFDGNVVSDKHDRKRSNKACAELEKQYNLIVSNHGELSPENRQRSNKADAAMGTDKIKSTLIERIENALIYTLLNTQAGAEFNPVSFKEACKKEGVNVHFNTTKAGQIQGVSFSLPGGKNKKYSGGKLRRDLTLGAIQNRFSEHLILSGNSRNQSVSLEGNALHSFKITENKPGQLLIKTGNWAAVAQLNSEENAFTLHGFPSKEITAAAAIQVAQRQGWGTIKIENSANETLTTEIKKQAAAAGIQVEEGHAREPVSIKDVLAGGASETDLATQQAQHQEHNNKESQSKGGFER